jgi:Tfp pilus assembly protein PilV
MCIAKSHSSHAGQRLAGQPRGFALIEVLVGSLLLAFGALTFATGLTLALRGQHASAARQLAVQSAADVAELLRVTAPEQRQAVIATWEANIASRWPPAAAPLAVRVLSVPSVAPQMPAWQVQLQWQDRIASQPLRLDASFGLAE